MLVLLRPAFLVVLERQFITKLTLGKFVNSYFKI